MVVAKSQNPPGNVVDDKFRRPYGMTEVMIQGLSGVNMTDPVSPTSMC